MAQIDPNIKISIFVDFRNLSNFVKTSKVRRKILRGFEYCNITSLRPLFLNSGLLQLPRYRFENKLTIFRILVKFKATQKSFSDCLLVPKYPENHTGIQGYGTVNVQ